MKREMYIIKKQIVALSVAVVLLFACVVFFVAADASDDIRVVVNGEEVVFEGQGPVVVDGRTLVPVRGVFEALGFGVNWDSRMGLVTLTRLNNLTGHSERITLRMGDAQFMVNWYPMTRDMEVPLQAINGRTMVPLRAPLESVGYRLSWDSSTRVISVFPELTGDAPVLTPIQPRFLQPQTEACVIPSGRPVIQTNQGLPSPEQMEDWYNSFVSTLVEEAIFYEINRMRVYYGLSELTRNRSLDSAAALRTAYLAAHNYGFVQVAGTSAHTYGSFYTRDLRSIQHNRREGFWGHIYTTSYASLHVASRTPHDYSRGPVGRWLNSPGHREILLSPYYNSVGVATGVDLTQNGAIHIYAFFDNLGE